MASLDFMKCTQANVGGLKVHLDQKCREELSHSNKHIQQELSRTNYMIGTKSYDESYERMLARTKVVDEEIPPKRVKKDRVICDMCYIPCINEIENKDEFFQKSYDFLVEKFGADNVHGAFIHKDEVHEYRDSRVRDAEGHQTIRTSMEHMHVMISPYTEEKGINSKAFNTREMFRNIQTEFDNFIYKEFGVRYQTKEQALGLEVEVLKEASEQLEQQEQQIQQLKEQISELEQVKETLQHDLNDQKEKVKELTNYNVKLTEARQFKTYFPSEAFREHQHEVKLGNPLNPFEKPVTVIEKEPLIKWYENASAMEMQIHRTASENERLKKELIVVKKENERFLTKDVNAENVSLRDENRQLKEELERTIDISNQWQDEYQKEKNRADKLQKTVNWYNNFYNQFIEGIHYLAEKGLETVLSWFDKDKEEIIMDDLQQYEHTLERNNYYDMER